LGNFPEPERGKVIPMIKRHEVQVLLRSGISHREVARQTGVSKRTVTRIAGEMPVGTIDDRPEVERRRIGRPGKVAEFEEKIRTLLEEERDLPTVEVLHRLRTDGYRGGKSAVYDLVRRLRGPAPAPVMVRFEGIAGEFAQFDFGQVQVRYLSGRKEKLHFACYRLKYSRWVHVEITPDERVEPLCRSLLNAFQKSGGVPLAVVFDNPKTVVLHPKKEPIVWNRTFAQLALDYSFGIELCEPRRGNQKGAVENLVGWVKGSFFKVRRFLDFEDLLQQLGAWLHEVNEERPNRATRVIPAVRLAEEQQRIRPLKIPPPEYGLQFEAFVGPTGVVSHQGIRYAMPAESIGFPATLHLYPDRVRIVAGRHEIVHARFPQRGLSYPPELRAEHLATISGKRGRLYFQRQRLLELGPLVVHFLTEVVHRRPRTWKGDIESLYQLLERHGEERLIQAVQAAGLRGLFGAEYVSAFVTEEVA
jgi:transposase